MEDYSKYVVSFDSHPLVAHKLSKLRDINTGSKEFGEIITELTMIMGYEVLKDLKTKTITIDAPLCKMDVPVLAQTITIVPILRAGLGMVDGIRDLIPTAKVGFIGMFRNEKTLQPKEYFAKFPDMSNATVMVLDPMLATGGSASAALTKIKERGAKNIKLVCLVGVPEGVKRIEEDHPDVDIYLAALDEKLNEIGYIVPGLGDAGDRIFGTK